MLRGSCPRQRALRTGVGRAGTGEFTGWVGGRVASRWRRCLKVVPSGSRLIFGPCRGVVLPCCHAKRGTWRSVARRMVYLLARNLLEPMRTPAHTGACGTFHERKGWDLLRARLRRLGLRRLCRHTTFRIPRRERRGFWPSCCSGRCRRVGYRRVRDRPCGWW